MKERFGERIRRLRTEQKLGLREFATKVGISPTYLSRIETSRRRRRPPRTSSARWPPSSPTASTS
ncbi:MAG: helix-turn-helix transcriptional regulator [Deltaproteobacteria bacterium]|nr:helix-turn-helix transcriptional regulator [Deltaproteobacteria bacterium]